jgi:coenzyme F420-reducing hydrogenase gamma subunit
MKGNVCMFHIGKTCLGPVTRAGCGAICPTYGNGCEGCRGIISNPNEDAMKDVLDEAGLTVDEIMANFTMFNTYPQMQAEASAEEKDQ